MKFTPHFSYGLIFPALMKTVGGWKCVSHPHLQWTGYLLDRNGDDQTLTTFSATTLENGLTIFCLHPLTESMGAFSADFAGLIGALAHVYYLLYLDYYHT